MAVPARVVSGRGGGKGGGGGAKEAPNTLFSRSTARIVDLLCEGEIGGPVAAPFSGAGKSLIRIIGTSILGDPGRAALQSVFIDGVPVVASDGSRNIEGIGFEFRLGAPDQDPLEGVPETESERVVGLDLRALQGAVQRTTSTPVHAVRVTIGFPALVRYNSRGDSNATTVQFRIETRATGGSWVTRLAPVIKEKNTSPAELSYRIALFGAAPHDVRVTRLTPDSRSDRVRDAIRWARMTEIAELRQSYPHSAVVGIVADAERYHSQLTRREYEVFGLLVDVPSNRDFETRAYEGLWDGTFRREWSDNPAWCAYDLLSNRRYGLGRELSPDALSAMKWHFYEIGRFCDEMVPDGEGGEEPRWRFDGVIASAADARRVVRDVLGSFGARVYWGSGQLVPVGDAPSDPVAIVGPANAVDGEMRVSQRPWSERVSAVAVSFADPDDGYRQGVELVIDDELVAKYGYRQKDVAALHCTRRSQAQRVGRHYLFGQEHESDALEYRGGLDAAGLRPGDVIRQHDPQVAGARLAGRVAGYGLAPGPRVSLFDERAIGDGAVLWRASSTMAVEERSPGYLSDDDGPQDADPIVGEHRAGETRVAWPGWSTPNLFVFDVGGLDARVDIPDAAQRALALRWRNAAGETVATLWFPLARDHLPGELYSLTYAASDALGNTTLDDLAPLVADASVAEIAYDVVLVALDAGRDVGAAALDYQPPPSIPRLALDSLEGVDSALAWTVHYRVPAPAPRSLFGERAMADGAVSWRHSGRMYYRASDGAWRNTRYSASNPPSAEIPGVPGERLRFLRVVPLGAPEHGGPLRIDIDAYDPATGEWTQTDHGGRYAEAIAVRWRGADGATVATAWAPLASDTEDPFDWTDERYRASGQTFAEDLAAVAAGGVTNLDYDAALVPLGLADGVVDAGSLAYRPADALAGVETRRVTAVDGDALVLEAAPDQAPLAGAMAVLESPDVEPRLWRVEEVRERDDLTFDVKARAHHPGRYAAVENATHVARPRLSLIPTGALPAPAAVTVGEYLYIESAHAHVAVVVGVEAPAAPDPRVVRTEIEIVYPDGDGEYVPLAETRSAEAEVRYAEPGLYRARARYVGEPASLRGPWTESPTTHVLGKTAPPAPPANFLLDELPDGTRRLRWRPAPDPDLLGTQLAFAERTSAADAPEWSAMAPMHAGHLVADHYETTEPSGPGLWWIAARSLDSSGIASEPVFVAAELGPSRTGDSGAILWRNPSSEGWPGVVLLGERSDDGLDALEAAGGLATWGDIEEVRQTANITWETIGAWNNSDPGFITGGVQVDYATRSVDLGAVLSFSLEWSADVSGSVEVQVKTSDVFDLLTHLPWRTYAPGELLTARVVRLRWRVSNVIDVVLPQIARLDHLQWSVVAPSAEERLRDLDTSDLPASPLRAGARELPTALSLVTDVSLTLQGVGGGWSWSLVAKTPTPVIAVFDGAGAPADAVIDAVIRGVK